MTIALIRELDASIQRCELTHLHREPIDAAIARLQHEGYADCLVRLGCELLRLPTEPEMPDSVFVEDTAVVLDELAILTRPGAASRRAETASIARALEPHRELVRIEAPGTLDGGDVLRLGRELCVGSSSRTNRAGLEQLERAVKTHGYTVKSVPVRGCLHLKSAVTRVSEDALLLNPEWVSRSALPRYELIEVDPGEPFAANALLVERSVVYPAAFPCTRERLEERGLRVEPVDVSELAKAEGGVTCCSLLFGPRA
jgi:dimethylargininase